jgi:hypothetical protein
MSDISTQRGDFELAEDNLEIPSTLAGGSTKDDGLFIDEDGSSDANNSKLAGGEEQLEDDEGQERTKALKEGWIDIFFTEEFVEAGRMRGMQNDSSIDELCLQMLAAELPFNTHLSAQIFSVPSRGGGDTVDWDTAELTNALASNLDVICLVSYLQTNVPSKWSFSSRNWIGMKLLHSSSYSG